MSGAGGLWRVRLVVTVADDAVVERWLDLSCMASWPGLVAIGETAVTHLGADTAELQLTADVRAADEAGARRVLWDAVGHELRDLPGATEQLNVHQGRVEQLELNG